LLTQRDYVHLKEDNSYINNVLLKAKKGDFRVQDDFGGSVYPYSASHQEIAFAQQVIAQCHELPVYARVDLMWDNQEELCISELELIEPELWLRTYPNASELMAKALVDYMNRYYIWHKKHISSSYSSCSLPDLVAFY
jgi:hypothetical protein